MGKAARLKRLRHEPSVTTRRVAWDEARELLEAPDAGWHTIECEGGPGCGCPEGIPAFLAVQEAKGRRPPALDWGKGPRW
jgi:hypothetical protein